MTYEDVLKSLEEYASNEWEMSWDEVTGKDRCRDIEVRRVATALAFLQFTDCSLHKTGQYFNRTHSTIIHYRQIAPYDDEIQYLLQGCIEHLTRAFDNEDKKHIFNQSNILMFRATITGNVGKDAEVKQTNGRGYASFSVGVANGKDSTTWVRVMQYSSNAEGLANLIKKGTPVCCSGRLQLGVYNGKADATMWADDTQVFRLATSKADLGDDLPI